jgi:hypothetical protein
MNAEKKKVRAGKGDWKRLTDSQVIVPPSDCPDANALAGYLDGRLSRDEETTIEKHLLSCDRCLDAVIDARTSAYSAPVPVPDTVKQRAKQLLVSGGEDGLKIPFRLWLWLMVSSPFFNLFFSFGLISDQANLEGFSAPDEYIEDITKLLNFDRDQRDHYKGFKAKLAEKKDAYKQIVKDDFNSFWAEMANEDPNEQVLRKHLGSIAEKLRDYRMSTTEFTIEFMKSLTTKQRKDYVHELKRSRII